MVGIIILTYTIIITIFYHNHYHHNLSKITWKETRVALESARKKVSKSVNTEVYSVTALNVLNEDILPPVTLLLIFPSASFLPNLIHVSNHGSQKASRFGPRLTNLVTTQNSPATQERNGVG